MTIASMHQKLIDAIGESVLVLFHDGRSPVLGELVSVDSHELVLDSVKYPETNPKGLWHIPIPLVAIWVKVARVNAVLRH